jgi:SRSO17 transposase
LPPEAILSLGDDLLEFWTHCRHCFWTQTRDQAPKAYHYLSGLLRMTKKRTFAGIGRTTGQPGENIQHFMTNSPWSARAVYNQVQADIAATPELRTGGMLLLDESADAKAGTKTAGAGRQRNGRLGKVDLCQVGVFLSFVKDNTWTWVDGELFLQEHWFEPKMGDERKRLGIPSDRTFKTKVELGWEMIQRAQANGLPFEAVGCDDLYGRANWFRAKMAGAGLIYMADVPGDTQVYLTCPKFGVPETPPGHKGHKYTVSRVLSDDKPKTVSQVAGLPDTHWQRIRVRPTERGELVAKFAVRRIWTMRDEKPTEEWLVIRRDADGDHRYALSNAPLETPAEDLAWMHGQRYFVERSIQDAKSEIGWDEFQAQKFRAWEHQLALTVLASWFVAQTKLRWAQQYPRDPKLHQELKVDLLPALSVANVRELLRAVMPLPQLSRDEAAAQVVKHLVNRTRSRKSRVSKKSSRPNHGARDPA